MRICLVFGECAARATITINKCLYERVRELLTNEIDVTVAAVCRLRRLRRRLGTRAIAIYR